MSLETTIASLVTAANNLTGAVNTKMGAIDERVETAEVTFNEWRANFSQTINGLEVYKQGGIKRFFFGQDLSEGGYTDQGGPDAAFPYCASPQPPHFINLLEIGGLGVGGFGLPGDMFRIEFIMAHRGMNSTDDYGDHLVFTGTSWSDCVSGQVEVKKVSINGAVSLFISEPNNQAHEIALTKAMVGTVIPVSFRGIGQTQTGSARVTLKVNSRNFCGAPRAFGADVTYTSNSGRPAANRVTQTIPRWDI